MLLLVCSNLENNSILRLWSPEFHCGGQSWLSVIDLTQACVCIESTVVTEKAGAGYLEWEGVLLNSCLASKDSLCSVSLPHDIVAGTVPYPVSLVDSTF